MGWGEGYRVRVTVELVSSVLTGPIMSLQSTDTIHDPDFS